MGKERYSSSDVVAKWQAKWDSWKIYSYDPNSPKKTFIVDTPPPTVSGSLHVGHVFSYTHQDILVRYERMQGKNIFYPMGWDDNGLPTERRVENFYNVRCDKSVPYDPDFVPKCKHKEPREIISRQNFIDLCNQMTVEDEKVFKELWSRIGLSVDWSLEYATISQQCRKISQISFIRLFEDGVAYQSIAPTMWDIDFSTAVAQAEAEDRDVQSSFYKLNFATEDGQNILIATTRPELLAACVGIVVHPEDKHYQHLVGKVAITPLFKVPVPIIADDKVEPDKGTGVVMVCTFGDTTDVEWWRDHNLLLRQIINKVGRLKPISFGTQGWESNAPDEANEMYSQLVGKNIKQARAAIVELLEAAGVIEGEPELVTRPVKFYEKGKRPLELISARQWYIDILSSQEQLLEQGNKITWHPPFMKERYKTWVKGLKQNWCISRQRHFGVPFPLWYPLDEHGKPCYDEPILPEINQLPIDPQVDVPTGYTAEQRNQPEGFIGDPDVQDTWATSSLTPQIVTNWVIDEEKSQKLLPMDVRPQSHEIIRTWAFYTIAKSWFHKKEIPWQHVLISGWILDPERKKMSKSKGNVVTPLKLIDTYSADSLRYWSARARAGVDTMYDENVFKIGKRLETKLYNASKFINDRIMSVDTSLLSNQAIKQELDCGFVQRLREVITVVSKGYEEFSWADSLQSLESFFWAEFCDDYLELIKSRAYNEPKDELTISALSTLKLSLSIILRLFAPVIPFITEEIWTNIFNPDEEAEHSIHVSQWPSLSELEDIQQPKATTSYEDARYILAELRREKGRAKVSNCSSVKSLIIYTPEAKQQGILDVLEDIRNAQAVENVEIKNQEDDISLDITLVVTVG